MKTANNAPTKNYPVIPYLIQHIIWHSLEGSSRVHIFPNLMKTDSSPLQVFGSWLPVSPPLHATFFPGSEQSRLWGLCLPSLHSCAIDVTKNRWTITCSCMSCNSDYRELTLVWLVLRVHGVAPTVGESTKQHDSKKCTRWDRNLCFTNLSTSWIDFLYFEVDRIYTVA